MLGAHGPVALSSPQLGLPRQELVADDEALRAGERIFSLDRLRGLPEETSVHCLLV